MKVEGKTLNLKIYTRPSCDPSVKARVRCRKISQEPHGKALGGCGEVGHVQNLRGAWRTEDHGRTCVIQDSTSGQSLCPCRATGRSLRTKAECMTPLAQESTT